MLCSNAPGIDSLGDCLAVAVGVAHGLGCLAAGSEAFPGNSMSPELIVPSIEGCLLTVVALLLGDAARLVTSTAG